MMNNTAAVSIAGGGAIAPIKVTVAIAFPKKKDAKKHQNVQICMYNFKKFPRGIAPDWPC